jgi:hypothetical protein
MSSNFETVWADITRTLHRGDIVQNWSTAKGHTGGTFKIDDVDRTSVTVSGGNMRAPRRISRGEFEKLYEIFDAYLAGNYPRSKMLVLSQNITYILSILHLVTNAQGRPR